MSDEASVRVERSDLMAVGHALYFAMMYLDPDASDEDFPDGKRYTHARDRVSQAYKIVDEWLHAYDGGLDEGRERRTLCGVD
jgi:hypothetical protein